MRESTKCSNIGFSDAAHHVFVKISLLHVISFYWYYSLILFANLVFIVFDWAHLLRFEIKKLNPNFSNLPWVESPPPEPPDRGCCVLAYESWLSKMFCLYMLYHVEINHAPYDGSNLFATTLNNSRIYCSYISLPPPTSDITIKFVSQFNDGGFHDDVNFAIPLKPPNQIFIQT